MFEIEGKVFRDSTGTYKWINWTISHLFGAGRDITSEKIAQIELQRSREELKRITDSIPGGVFQYRVDENGVETFPFVSKGAMHVFGAENKLIASSDCEGMTIYKEDLIKLKDAMQQAKQLETSLDCDYRVVQNGDIRWVRVHAVPQKGQGDSVEWCGLIWDMTEDRIQVNTLKEERDNAERAAQTKARFLANMSHEIRTPMNAVIGMGSLLLETDLDGEQREYVTTICSSGESLLSIINDILDFSKIEAGKMELEAKAFDLMRCIEESLDLFLPQAASKGIELNYTVTDMVPAAVSGDVVRIRQILVNLLSNAMKFTEKGCICINLSACKLQECIEGTGKISYDTTPSLGQSLYKPWEIHFAVKDNGIGIPQDRINSLFQAFTQVDASTTRKYGGTGLGLAICARLCTLHGGRIWVESTYGHGSTFHFTVIAEEATMPSEEKTSDKDALKEKRVLIVAKSSTSSQVMCNKFTKSWGMRPLMAITIIEALQVLRRALEISSKNQGQKSSVWNDPFSVAIIDSAMFQEEKTQLIECVKLCQAVVPQIPVILLTPYGQKNQDSEYGIEFSAYVSKPVKSASLLKSLMNIVCKTELPVPTRSHSTDIGSQEDMGKNFPMKILVAEDNIINQKVLKKLLEKLGYVADYVDTGCKAIDSIKRQRYDVCLMDCFMPEMDGLEATKHLRAMVDPCPIIVAVTAAALEEEKQACLEAGMHMYISKPIQAEVLKQTLHKCWKIKEGILDIGSLQL